MPIVAWYMLSKESYMKRVMREVLPTVIDQYDGLKLPVYLPAWRTTLFAKEYKSVRVVSNESRSLLHNCLLELLQRVRVGRAHR